jgi:prolyl 4-hydroxylase
MSQATLEHSIQLMNAGRIEEGAQMLREIAAAGDPEALFVLADMTWSGTKVPQDPARGRLLFEYSAALGHPRANVVATNLLGNGVAGRRNWPAALERLAAEARQLPDRTETLALVEAMSLNDNGDPTDVPEPIALSDQPFALMCERLVTPAECAYLIKTAEPLFRPSMVYDKSGRAVKDTMRTSDGAGFNWLLEDPAIHAINRRIAKATGTRYLQGEALQVLRYVPGQEYRPHFDFLEGAENPRPWTALLYLNEDYDGGATAFVETALEVRGRTGDVLAFRNEGEDGRRDPLAKHAGTPVTGGTKYLATRWIRQKRWIP